VKARHALFDVLVAALVSAHFIVVYGLIPDRWRWPALGAIAAVVLAKAAWWWRRRRGRADIRSP
jgi:hypothetical protein